MSHTLFYKKIGDIAADETRAFIVPKGHKLLPTGEYGLLELYCDTPGCDCRRVIFWIVRSDHPDRALATVNFGWETVEFYRQWMGTSDGVDEMVGASLEPLGPQSKYSEALLALCKYALQDNAYLERIKQHYQLFRDAVEGR